MFNDMVSALVLSLALGADLSDELSAAMGCSDERPCSVTQEFKADSNAVPIRVYELSQGEKDLSTGGTCELREFWARVGKKGKPRLVLSLCNDGYGSAGVGEDEVQVKPNKVIHEQIGGAQQRWVVNRELQLNPLALMKTSILTFPTESPQFTDETRWSWDQFSGERIRMFSLCTDDGQPDRREDAKPRALRSALIPQVAVTKSYAEGGWKDTQLGTCAARASYPLQGAAGADSDSVLKVVALSERELVIEITDDVIGKGDQLQFWLFDRAVSPLDGCLGKDGVQASQWVMDVLTGQARAGHNSRFGVPTAEVAKVGQQVRLRVRLPEGSWPGLTLAYADSDDGKFLERTMATSQFVFAQAATLGSLHTLERKMAQCDVVNGELSPKTATGPASGKGAAFTGKTGGK